MTVCEFIIYLYMYEYAYMVLAFVGGDFLLVYPSFLKPVLCSSSYMFSNDGSHVRSLGFDSGFWKTEVPTQYDLECWGDENLYKHIHEYFREEFWSEENQDFIFMSRCHSYLEISCTCIVVHKVFFYCTHRIRGRWYVDLTSLRIWSSRIGTVWVTYMTSST